MSVLTSFAEVSPVFHPLVAMLLSHDCKLLPKPSSGFKDIQSLISRRRKNTTSTTMYAYSNLMCAGLLPAVRSEYDASSS